MCIFCSSEGEDLKHIMIECDFARQTWSLTHLPWSIIVNWGDAAEAWIRHLHQNLEAWEYRFALPVAWKIWYWRNKALMENSHVSSLELVESCRWYLQDFDVASLPFNQGWELL
ncbi:hypothetical protein Salat_1909000 [Sesamum alatum]|uniref:Reverse transcriptase zinc-binding domain-containing protein n=1 Tax=Sesamum alatum TaxID=300844 RepID=A0AAE1Y4E2_9LAMI|nr:hypothetical protein Salat_1909000 [Sesamum alatum]